MVTNNFDWLATNQEPAFDPDQKIIDPHHHLWDGREDAGFCATSSMNC